MSKDVTPDQRRRIVEELADIATKLETARDSSAKANHAIVDFNRACEKAGRLVILAIDSGILPHDCLPSATWKQYETKPSTDREMSFYWTVGVAPWLRSVAGPAFVGAGAGRRDFPRYKRNHSGKLIDANGKPLKLVKSGNLNHPDPLKRTGSQRLKGEPATIEDDYDDADKLHHIRYRIDDLIHDCKTLGRYLQSEFPPKKPLSTLTVTEAARLFVNADIVDGLTFNKAKARISAAANRGKFQAEGKGPGRRIDPSSLSGWLLQLRSQELGIHADEECNSA